MCQTRADGLGLTVKVADEANFEYTDDVCGVMVQYPATDGRVLDYSVGGAVLVLLLVVASCSQPACTLGSTSRIASLSMKEVQQLPHLSKLLIKCC